MSAKKGTNPSKSAATKADAGSPARFLLSGAQIDTFAKLLEEHMPSHPKILVLIRGVPGMGKSYVAKQLTEKLLDGEGAVNLETDQQFVTGGDYVYDPSKIELAHQNTQTETKHLMMERAPLLLISNTFTRFWEMQEYLELAQAYCYYVVVYDLYMQINANICAELPAHCGKKFPLKEELVPFLTGNNEHGVPADKIKQMIERYEYDTDIVTVDYLAAGKGWTGKGTAGTEGDAIDGVAAIVPRTLTGPAALSRSFKVLDFGHCLVLDITVAEDSAHPFHSSAYRCCIIGCQFLLRCYGMKAGYQMIRKLTQRNAKSHGTFYARSKTAGAGKGAPPHARGGGNYMKHMAGWTRFHITLLSPSEYSKLKKQPALKGATAVKSKGGKKNAEADGTPGTAVEEFVKEAQSIDFSPLIQYFDAMLAEQLTRFKALRSGSASADVSSPSGSQMVLPMGVIQGPITDSGGPPAGGRRDETAFALDDFARAAGLSKNYSTAAYLQLQKAPLQSVELLRSKYNLLPEDWIPHITLGFTHNDIHADANVVLQTMSAVRVRAVKDGAAGQDVLLQDLNSKSLPVAPNRKRQQNGGGKSSGRMVVMEIDDAASRTDKKNRKRRKKNGHMADVASAKDDESRLSEVPGSEEISTEHGKGDEVLSDNAVLGVRDIGRHHFMALVDFIVTGGSSGCRSSILTATTNLVPDDGVSDLQHCSLAELMLYSEVNASFKGAYNWTSTTSARTAVDAAVAVQMNIAAAEDKASTTKRSGPMHRPDNSGKVKSGGSDGENRYSAQNHFGFVICDLKVRRGPMGDDATYRAHNFLQQHLPRGLCYVQHASNVSDLYPALFSIRKFYGKEGMEDDGIGINASQMKFKLSRILENTVQLMIMEKINGRAGSCRFFHFLNCFYAVVGTKVSHVVVKVDTEHQRLELPPEIEKFRALYSSDDGSLKGSGGGAKLAGVSDYDGNKLIASNAVGLEKVLKWSEIYDFARWLNGKTLNGEVLDPAEMHLVTLSKHEWVSLCVTDFTDAVLNPDDAVVPSDPHEKMECSSSAPPTEVSISLRTATNHAVQVMHDLERYVSSLPSCDLCRIDNGVDNLSFESPWDSDVHLNITDDGTNSSLVAKKETYNCIADFIVFADGSEGKVMYYLDRQGRVLELMKYKTWWYVWRRSVREICARMFSYYFDGSSTSKKDLQDRKTALERQQQSMLSAKKESKQSENFTRKLQEVQTQLQEIRIELQASQRGATYNLQPYATKITQEIRKRWRSKFSFFKKELGDRYDSILAQVIRTACEFVMWASEQFKDRKDAFHRDFKTKYPVIWSQFLEDTGCEDTF